MGDKLTQFRRETRAVGNAMAKPASGGISVYSGAGNKPAVKPAVKPQASTSASASAAAKAKAEAEYKAAQEAQKKKKKQLSAAEIAIGKR